MKKYYILYDERAKCGTTDDATILSFANSEQEVRKSADGEPGIWYEYDREPGTNKITNERIRNDLPT